MYHVIITEDGVEKFNGDTNCMFAAIGEEDGVTRIGYKCGASSLDCAEVIAAVLTEIDEFGKRFPLLRRLAEFKRQLDEESGRKDD